MAMLAIVEDFWHSQTYALKIEREAPRRCGFDRLSIQSRKYFVHRQWRRRRCTETYSMLSVIDTTSRKKVADIKVDGETLEAMALESASPKSVRKQQSQDPRGCNRSRKARILASWPHYKGQNQWLLWPSMKPTTACLSPAQAET